MNGSAIAYCTAGTHVILCTTLTSGLPLSYYRAAFVVILLTAPILLTVPIWTNVTLRTMALANGLSMQFSFPPLVPTM